MTQIMLKIVWWGQLIGLIVMAVLLVSFGAAMAARGDGEEVNHGEDC